MASCRFRLEGHLDTPAARRFEGLCAMSLRSGKTMLVGPIADQAALFGTLDRIHDIGAVLLGVRRIGDVRSGAGQRVRQADERIRAKHG